VNENVDALTDALRAVMTWLREERIPGAIIGGVAASLVGRPRLTADVDAIVLVDDGDWERAIGSAARYGLTPRIADVLEFAMRTRVVLLRHENSGIDVDVSLGALEFEREVIERASIVSVGSLQLRLATAEDLIIMKALARRPRDIADIEALLTTHPDSDLRRIRHYLREFSSILAMPEIHEEFEAIFRRVQSSHP
jgi:predicted nucleotidyltransferase